MTSNMNFVLRDIGQHCFIHELIIHWISPCVSIGSSLIELDVFAFAHFDVGISSYLDHLPRFLGKYVKINEAGRICRTTNSQAIQELTLIFGKISEKRVSKRIVVLVCQIIAYVTAKHAKYPA